MASASPASAPRASSTLAVGVYFHEFSNLDLLSQGWYAVRCRARLADDGTASRAPRWASAVGVTPAPMHPDRAAECVPPNPSLDWRLDGDRPSRSECVDDADADDADDSALSRASSSSSPGAYTTRAFEVRFARERFPVEHLVRFQFLLDPLADDVALASVVVDFELLHVPYASRDRARPDTARPPARAHLDRAVVAVDHVVIARAPGGVHEYHPVHFDETHLTLCDVTLHAAATRVSVEAARCHSDDAATRARFVAPLLDAAEATRAVVSLAAPGGFAAGEDGSWAAALDARDDPEGVGRRRLGSRADIADALASASSASANAWAAFVDAVARGGGERGGGGGWVLSPTRARWERRRDVEWSPWIARSNLQTETAETAETVETAQTADAADVVVTIESDDVARDVGVNELDAANKLDAARLAPRSTSSIRSRRLFRDEAHASHTTSPTVTMEDAVPAPSPPRSSLAATIAASRSRVARLARDDSFSSGGGSSLAESTPAGSDVEDDGSPAAEERRRRRRRRRRLSADGREDDDGDEGGGGESPSSRPRGGLMAAAMEAARGLPQGEHVVVLVHGFAGSLQDLRLIRAHLSAVAPNAHTVVSSANHGRTSASSLEEMGARLATETAAAMEHLEAEGWPVRGGGRRPRCAAAAAAEAAARESARPRLSFVGHSMGCLVIRAAMTHPALAPHLDRLHAFLSVSGPHLGYGGDAASRAPGCFAPRRSAFEWALRAFGRVASRAKCLREMTLSDARRPEEGYLWRLAHDPRASLGKFRHVVLVSSPQDGYVPRGSARVDADDVLAERFGFERFGFETSASARRGSRARARREMARAILSPVLEKARALRGAESRVARETVTSLCLVDVHFPRPRRRSLSSWIGRKAHTDFLETHAWIKYVLWAHRHAFA